MPAPEAVGLAVTTPSTLSRAPGPTPANVSAAGRAATAADMKAIVADPTDARVVARLSASSFYNAQMRTTCVATRLNAGHANTALPQLAQANVNCRILPGHSGEEIRQELDAYLKPFLKG